MATKKGCRRAGKAAPKTRGGPCGKKLKRVAKKRTTRKRKCKHGVSKTTGKCLKNPRK